MTTDGQIPIEKHYRSLDGLKRWPVPYKLINVALPPQIEVQRISSAPKCTFQCTSVIRFSYSALHFTLKCIALGREVHYASLAVYVRYPCIHGQGQTYSSVLYASTKVCLQRMHFRGLAVH